MNSRVRIALAPYGLENRFVEITGAPNQNSVQEAARRALDLLSPRLERMDQRDISQRIRLIRTELPDLIKRVDSTTNFTALTIVSGAISDQEEELSLGRFNRLKDAQHAVEQSLRKHFPANKPFSSPEQKQRFWTRAMGKVLQELQCSAALTEEEKADRIVILANLYRDGCVLPLPPHSAILAIPPLKELSGLPQEPLSPLDLKTASAELVRHGILSPSVVWATKMFSEGHSVRIEDLDRIRHTLRCSQEDALRCIALCLKSAPVSSVEFDGKFALTKQLQRYYKQLTDSSIKDSALRNGWEKTLTEPERLASAIDTVWSSLYTTTQDDSYLALQLAALTRHVESLERDWTHLTDTVPSFNFPLDDLRLVSKHLKSAMTDTSELQATTTALNQLIHQLDQALPVFPALSSLRSLPPIIGGNSLESSLKNLVARVQYSRAALTALRQATDDRPRWLRILLAIFTLLIATAISYAIRAIPYKREKKRLEALLHSDLAQAQSALERTSLALTKLKSAAERKYEPEIRKATQELSVLSIQFQHLASLVTSTQAAPPPVDELELELGRLAKRAGYVDPNQNQFAARIAAYECCTRDSSERQLVLDINEFSERLWRSVEDKLHGLSLIQDESEWGLPSLFEFPLQRSSIFADVADTVKQQLNDFEIVKKTVERSLNGTDRTKAIERLDLIRAQYLKHLTALPLDQQDELLSCEAAQDWKMDIPLGIALDALEPGGKAVLMGWLNDHNPTLRQWERLSSKDQQSLLGVLTGQLTASLLNASQRTRGLEFLETIYPQLPENSEKRAVEEALEMWQASSTHVFEAIFTDAENAVDPLLENPDPSKQLQTLLMHGLGQWRGSMILLADSLQENPLSIRMPLALVTADVEQFDKDWARDGYYEFQGDSIKGTESGKIQCIGPVSFDEKLAQNKFSPSVIHGIKCLLHQGSYATWAPPFVMNLAFFRGIGLWNTNPEKALVNSWLKGTDHFPAQRSVVRVLENPLRVELVFEFPQILLSPQNDQAFYVFPSVSCTIEASSFPDHPSDETEDSYVKRLIEEVRSIPPVFHLSIQPIALPLSTAAKTTLDERRKAFAS